MAIDEKALYETLGLPYEEQGGGGDPAPETRETTEEPETTEAPEAGEPEETGGDGGPEGEDSSGAGGRREKPQEGEKRPGKAGAEPEPTKPPEDGQRQILEQRARAAESRRQAQQRRAVEEALAQERAAEDQRWREFFATAGLKSPVDGKPITTRAEYEAYQRSLEERRIRQNLQKGQLLPEDIEALVRRAVAQQLQTAQAGENPRQTSEAENQQQSAPERPAAEGRTVTQEQVDAELEEIRQLDPEMTGLEAILASETGEAFRAAVARGASFIEAFKLANFDRLRQKASAETAKRAEQAALNKARSKDHLQTARTSGSGSVAVPAELKEMYHYLMPGKTDAEIQAHYNRTLRESK